MFLMNVYIDTLTCTFTLNSKLFIVNTSRSMVEKILNLFEQDIVVNQFDNSYSLSDVNNLKQILNNNIEMMNLEMMNLEMMLLFIKKNRTYLKTLDNKSLISENKNNVKVITCNKNLRNIHDKNIDCYFNTDKVSIMRDVYGQVINNYMLDNMRAHENMDSNISFLKNDVYNNKLSNDRFQKKIYILYFGEIKKICYTTDKIYDFENICLAMNINIYIFNYSETLIKMLDLLISLEYENEDDVQNMLKTLKLVYTKNDNVTELENLVKLYINNNYEITEDVNNRIKSSILLKEITKFIDNQQYLQDIKDTVLSANKLAKYLDNIGVKKKRFSDGYYYFGLKQISYSLNDNKLEINKEYIKNIEKIRQETILKIFPPKEN